MEFTSVEMPWLKFYEKDNENINVDFNLVNMSIYEYMKKGNINNPESIAIDYFDRKITFGEFLDFIDQYAAAYKAQGVNSGEIVAICMANTPEALISVYALNKLGAKVQLIHPLSSANEIKESLNKTKAKIMIALDSTYYKIKLILDETALKRIIISSPKNSMPTKLQPLYEINKVLGSKKIHFKIIESKVKNSVLSRRIRIVKKKIEHKTKVNLDSFKASKKMKLYQVQYEIKKEESKKLKSEIERLQSKKNRLTNEDIYYHEFCDERFITIDEFLLSDYNKVESYNWKKDECAILLSTGGTSGKSKLAMLTNENFNSMLEQFLISFHRFKRGDSALAIMPLFHGFGLCSCLHLPLSFGVTVVMVPKFQAKDLYKLYKKKRPEYIIGVPAIFEAFKKDKRIGKKVGFSFVKLFVAGGDRLKETKEKEYNDYFASNGAVTKIAKGYGLTEGVAGVTLATDEYNNPNSIGIPMYGNIIKIVKPGTIEELSYGEEGEICLYGPTVMLGYYEDDVETKKTLIKHSDGKTYLHTGDLGFMTVDGIIYYTQRLKRMIICNGYNIHSAQVESAVEELDFVDSCELIGKSHPLKGQIPVVYVVLKEGVVATDTLKKQIMNTLKNNISAYALPALEDIKFIKELPKTLLNKVAFTELGNTQELEIKTITLEKEKQKILNRGA